LNKERYIRLIEDFCRLSQLNDPLRIIDGGPVEVGDVSFSLLYSEKINPMVLLVYCEFGVPPAAREADAYRVLLQRNLTRYDGNGGPVFSLSGRTGRVLCANRLPLEHATAEQLNTLLSDMADQAQQWRADYGMGEADAAARDHVRSRRPARFARPPLRR
jgi:hypothetical protein